MNGHEIRQAINESLGAPSIAGAIDALRLPNHPPAEYLNRFVGNDIRQFYAPDKPLGRILNSGADIDPAQFFRMLRAEVEAAGGLGQGTSVELEPVLGALEKEFETRQVPARAPASADAPAGGTVIYQSSRTVVDGNKIADELQAVIDTGVYNPKNQAAALEVAEKLRQYGEYNGRSLSAIAQADGAGSVNSFGYDRIRAHEQAAATGTAAEPPDIEAERRRLQTDYELEQKFGKGSATPPAGAAAREAVTESPGVLARIASALGFGSKAAGGPAAVVLGTAAAGATLLATGSGAQAAETFVETAVPFGEAGLAAADGDMAAAVDSGAIETIQTVAAALGGAVAAAAGAGAIGIAAAVVVPPVVVGALAQAGGPEPLDRARMEAVYAALPPSDKIDPQTQPELFALAQYKDLLEEARRNSLADPERQDARVNLLADRFADAFHGFQTDGDQLNSVQQWLADNSAQAAPVMTAAAPEATSPQPEARRAAPAPGPG